MKRLALFLAATILLAGCTAFQSGEDKPKQIEVSGPTCTVNGKPCGSVQLTRFDTPRITMTVENNGESPVEVMLDEGGSGADGSNVLVSDCNIYTLAEEDGFTARRATLSGVETVTGADTVELEGGERLELEWNLELADVDVSRLGYTCPLGFALTFDQELETSRQVQVKAGEDIPDASALQTSTTSRWPVRLNIETEDRVLDDRAFVARAFLRDLGPGDVRGVGGGGRDIVLGFGQEGATAECTGKTDVGMYGAGERQGESFREVCSFTPAEVENSEVHGVAATTEYTYRMDLRSVRLSVIPVEGGG